MATPRTAPKAAAPRKAAKFNIAAAEKEFSAVERPEPFDIELSDGTRVELLDPVSLDWHITASLTVEQPFTFFRTLIEDDEVRDKFFEERFSTSTLAKIIEAWQDYYQVPSAGN